MLYRGFNGQELVDLFPYEEGWNNGVIELGAGVDGLDCSDGLITSYGIYLPG